MEIRMEIGLGIKPSQNFDIPYIGSLSTVLRLSVMASGPSGADRIREILEGVIQEIVNTPGVGDLLKVKNSTLSALGANEMRQCDIRSDDKVIFKTFTYWDHNRDCWIILAELGDETFWEDKNQKIGVG